jgi:hypothetical protein
MTIVYPREMPASGAASQEFYIQRVDYAAPEASGKVGGVQAGFPLWMATWTLGRISAASADEWTAWIDSLRGSQRRFLARDYSRPFPRAYPNGFAGIPRHGGGSLFDGTATGWDSDVQPDGQSRMLLSGLPSNFVLTHRDYIGLKWNSGDPGAGYDRATLVRVTDPHTAIAGLTNVGVEPAIPTWIPPDAVAYFERPACVMVLLADGARPAAMDRRLTIQGTKIAAVQDLQP